MIQFKIEEIAGKTAIVLDDAALERLGAGLGDVLSMDETSVAVSQSESETDRQLAIARRIMVDYRETLDALAR